MTEEQRNIVRELRRAAGFLAKRFSDLKLEQVEDPRRAAGKRWRLDAVLRTVLVAMMAGCKSPAEVEDFTSEMSGALRRQLGIKRRIPDTTLRSILLRLDPEEVRRALHAFTLAAWRRKAFSLFKLPFHVVSLDGKGTATSTWDDEFSQRHRTGDRLDAYGVVRTVNACLISTRARPIIDTTPIPSETNESGIFPVAFASLVKNYGHTFRLVTYDAGVPSEENCKLVVDSGKDFNFRIKNENWHCFREAEARLGHRPLADAAAVTEDIVCKRRNRVVVRRVFMCKAPRLSFIWSTVKTFVRVHVQHIEDGKLITEENRYYISSLEKSVLTPKQWLHVARGHWGVENNVHWVLDAIFKEDDRPWIRTVPKGMVVVMMLRRIACAMLAVFRVALMRQDEARALPWRALLEWFHRTALALTATDLVGLNGRQEATATT